MNILDVFKDKGASVLKGSGQEVSEKLLELATFFYKIDRRVSLEELKYIEELMASIEWSSSISVESFQRGCITRINNIICCSDDQVLTYLSNLMNDLEALGATAKAQELAKEISDSDGEIADDETKYLELVMSFS